MGIPPNGWAQYKIEAAKVDALRAQLAAEKARADRMEAAIREAIQLLGMDRPINPSKYLREALEGK